MEFFIGFDHILSVILRFLPPALLLERILEFVSLVFESIGLFRGDAALIGRIASIKLLENPGQAQKKRLRKQLALQSLGAIIGIILCWKSGLRIFYLLGFQQGQIADWIDILLSGILISGGTEPIHSLITFLQNAKEKAKSTTEKLAEEKRRRSGVELVPEVREIPIEYNGGLYPDRTGHGLRQHNPTYIVYHHTATHHDASFDKIVAIERKERRTTRGRRYSLDPSYHCVITGDGQYHNYCRWDSIGYHCKRGRKVSNGNSLGIALVGNFETDPNVQGNNADGQFGPKTPTEEQLDMAAQVIAVWMLLYKIGLQNILPHKDVLKGHTVCPGNNFPHDLLKRKVAMSYEQWAKSPAAQQELIEFKKKDLIYV